MRPTVVVAITSACAVVGGCGAASEVDADGGAETSDVLGDGLDGAETSGDAGVEGAIATDEFGLQVRPDRLLVEPREGVARDMVEAAVARAGGHVVGWLVVGALVEVDVGEEGVVAMRRVEAALEAQPEVAGVVRDHLVRVARSADDYTRLGDGLGDNYARMHVDEAKSLFESCAWQLGPEDLTRTLTVCVVDNDLQGVRDAPAYAGVIASFVDAHTHPTVEFCGRSAGGNLQLCEASTLGHHGSAVSSVVLGPNDGVGPNGLLTGFIGEGPTGPFALDAKLRLFNVGHGGSASILDIFAALEAAAQTDCKVVNRSFETAFPPGFEFDGEPRVTAHYRSLARLVDAFPQTLFVFAAGNGNLDLEKVIRGESLRRDNLMVIGATTRDDQRASYSNHGDGQIDLAAPGDRIDVQLVDVRHTGTSLFPVVQTLVIDAAGRFELIDGTSFAAPLVTAAAAWLRAFEPGSGPVGVKRWLQRTGTPIQVLGGRLLDMKRVVTDVIASRIHVATTHLLEFDGPIASTGDAGCATLLDHLAHACVAVVKQGSDLSAVADARDVNGQRYTIAGTVTEATFDFTISGMGITPGVGPATSRLHGAVTRPPKDEGDYVLQGAIEGESKRAAGAPLDCRWTGTVIGRLHGRVVE